MIVVKKQELCGIYHDLPEHILERSPQYKNSDEATQKQMRKKMKFKLQHSAAFQKTNSRIGSTAHLVADSDNKP